MRKKPFHVLAFEVSSVSNLLSGLEATHVVVVDVFTKRPGPGCSKHG